MMQKAFFLDRDGTINVDYNYVHKPEEWTWCTGAVEAIKWMNENNYKVIIVTNQSGIARGKYTMKQVNQLHQWVNKQLKKFDAHVDDWYTAPFHPEHSEPGEHDPADRKPGTGMFKKAKETYNIDFNRSYMAGDKVSDLKPALSLGMTPFFITSRYEPDQDKNWLKKHRISVFDNIGEVVDYLSGKDI